MKRDCVEASSLARGDPASEPAGAARLAPLTPRYVLARLAGSERALLLREIVPLATIESIQDARVILLQLQAQGRVKFNAQTDRWSLAERGVLPAGSVQPG